MTNENRSIYPGVVRFALWVLLGSLSAVPSGAATQNAGAETGARSAREIVDRLHGALIQSMKDGGRLSFEERFDRLDPVVSESFDISYIASVALGKHMDGLSEDQRALFMDVFSRYMVANYAHNFSSFEGQRFQFRVELKQRDDVMVIRTQFVGGDGETRDFDYQLRRRQNRWFIVNVAVDGVSDLALKRTQYDAVIRKDGFDALVDRLKTRITEMSNEPAN